MSENVGTLAIAIAAVIGVIILQLLLPFMFDFLSTLGVYGIGFWSGRKWLGNKL